MNASTNRRRILLVEDDDGIRAVTRTTLEALGGHEVLAVESGEQAVQQAAGFAPDLLLLDVAMPGMDGPQTLAALRRQAPLATVPAVFLTAHTQSREVVHYRSLGVRDVIAKPFEPAQLCERIAAALSAAGEPETQAAARTALVVEDDPSVRFLLGFVLEQNGWHMIACEDGEQGLQAIEHGPLADVVLLDIVLPGHDGLFVLEALRKQPRWREVPVMMLTGKGDEALVTRAISAGANDYLGKPFDFAELMARLERLPRPRT